MIADACLAAHEATGDAEPRLRAMIEAVLFELGFRIAAVNKEHGIGPDHPTQTVEREPVVQRRPARRATARRRDPSPAQSWPPRNPVANT
jgi:hypothetical protein